MQIQMFRYLNVTTVSNLFISTAFLIIFLLTSKSIPDSTCTDGRMINEINSNLVKSNEFKVEDDPNEQFNMTSYLRELSDKNYATVVDGTLSMHAATFRRVQWDPTSDEFTRFGKRYLKKCGVYEYKQVSRTNDEAHYTYKVKMSSMIGPDHADQEQFHHVLVTSPRYTVIKVTVKTQNYPYSDTFYISQM